MSVAEAPRPHPLAGRTVRLQPFEPAPVVLRGAAFVVEGTAGEVGVRPSTPAAIQYMARMRAAGMRGARLDDALYGKVDGLGHCVHLLEVGGVVDGR